MDVIQQLKNNLKKRIITNTMVSLIYDIVSVHHFKKLLCRISSRKTRSIKVALHSGFELDGTIRYDYKTTKREIVDFNSFVIEESMRIQNVSIVIWFLFLF